VKNKNKNLPAVKQTQEVTIQPEQSPMAIMEMAMNKNFDIDRIEKMLEIQEKWESNEARKAYHQDMSEFKTEHIIILKDKENKQYNSMYATHGNIVNTVSPILSKYGFSHKFDIEQEKELVKVTCVITHCKGHSESSFMFAPLDKSGSKNAIQQIKSTRTYLKSATFEDALGIAPVDDNFDDDGNGHNQPNIEYIDDKQKSTILDMVASTNTTEEEFLNYLKVDSIDNIPASIYNVAIAALNTKAEVLRKESENDSN